MLGTVITFKLMKFGQKQFAKLAAIALLVGGFAVTSFVSAEARADSAGPFGLGLVIGDPTGLSMNYRLSSDRSVDAALAWNFGRWSGFEMHADYLLATGRMLSKVSLLSISITESARV